MTSFIAVAGAKGGVGRTTTVINLAAALESFNRDTIIVDCHFKKPNVGLYLGFSHAQKTINSTLNGDNGIIDALYHHSSGIDVVPAQVDLKEIEKKFDGHLVADALYELLYKTEVVLVDTSGDLAETKEIFKACDQVLVVTHADQVSITDTLKTLRIARELNKKVLGAVVSHSKNRNIDVALVNIEGTLQVPVIGEIPYDESIQHAFHANQPVIVTSPTSESAHAYKKLAANLIGEEYVASIKKEKPFGTYLLERMGFKNPKPL